MISFFHIIVRKDEIDFDACYIFTSGFSHDKIPLFIGYGKRGKFPAFNIYHNNSLERSVCV